MWGVWGLKEDMVRYVSFIFVLCVYFVFSKILFFCLIKIIFGLVNKNMKFEGKIISLLGSGILFLGFLVLGV